MVFGVAALAVTVAGCQTDESGLPVIDFNSPPPPLEAPPPIAPTVTMRNPDDVRYYPSDEPLRLGVEYFSRGNYGIAERYFQDATEKAPKDPTAWLGLAASYDRLRRFDLADRAYAQVRKLTGETVQLLNDEGYSNMLRGNYPRARALFLRASKLDPSNPTIINNLQLLDGSSRFTSRAVDPPTAQ